MAVAPVPTASGRPARLAGAPAGPRQRDQRLAALLDAAAALFVEKGMAATSIDDIAERAGVAKGTFYHYFQDRSAMLEALRQRYSQHFADAAEAAAEACAPGDWGGRLDGWIQAIVGEYLATYALHDAIFHDAVICQRCVMSDEPFIRFLAGLLADGVAAGVWATEDPLKTATFMFYGLHGALDEVIAGDGDRDAVAPYLSRLFRNMLRPD
jgi:AcrR family transcriptional regulator